MSAIYLCSRDTPLLAPPWFCPQQTLEWSLPKNHSQQDLFQLSFQDNSCVYNFTPVEPLSNWIKSVLDLCEGEGGLDLESDELGPLLNHWLQLLRIAHLLKPQLLPHWRNTTSKILLRIDMEIRGWMELTRSPFASRMRSPGLSSPCLSMNESMMIRATITFNGTNHE